jgi:hypothetical protein
MADLPLQRLRPEIPGAAVQPTLLPRARMSGEAAPLAGGQASAEMPRQRRRAAAACGGGTAATPTEGKRSQDGEGRPSHGDRRFRACAWSRSKEASGSFLRSTWLLRACPGIAMCAGLVLRRRLSRGHEPGSRSRAQVLAAQRRGGAQPALRRVRSHTRETLAPPGPCRRPHTSTSFGAAAALAVRGL